MTNQQIALTETELAEAEVSFADYRPMVDSGTSINPLRSFTVTCADNGRILTWHDVKLGYKVSGSMGNGLNLHSLVCYILVHFDRIDDLYVNLRQSRLIPFSAERIEYTVTLHITEESPEAKIKAYSPKTYKRNRRQLS